MHQPTRAFPWYLASVGSWFSSFGMQTIVFPWLVTVVLHESPARVGIAQMSLMAPSLLFMLLGGAVADRAACRRLLVRGHLLVALLGLAIGRGWLAYGGLIAYALAGGTIGAFVMPTRDAMLTRVAEGGLGRAVAIMTATQFAAQLAGIAVGAAAGAVGAPALLFLQVREMQVMVGEPRSASNLVLVSHGSTILALTGVSLDSGEMVVVTPQGAGRFAVIGRLTAHGP